MLKGYENKKIYIQLSKKFNLSLDILIYIYNLVQQSYLKDEDIRRLFYKNIMIFNLMDYKEWPMLSLPASLLEDKIEEKNPNAFRSFPSLKDDIFKHRLPDNKGLEWVIKSYPSIRNSYSRTLTCIKIFGEENYLLQREYINDQDDSITFEANDKLKLKYLNDEPFNEVLIDYNNYLEWKDTELVDTWKLFLDEYGQPSFL